MNRGLIISFTIFIIFFPFVSFSKEISYTQDDRDRLIRVEEGLKAVNQRIDSLQNLLYVVIAGIFALIGFVIWVRRSALAPAIKKNKELEEKHELLEKAIKEYSRKQPDLAEILKSLGIL